MTKQEWFENLFLRLGKSKFRSRFYLDDKDKEYVRQKGLDTIEAHAKDFVLQRIAPAVPANDGKQTPMRGHPVFKAQHATATCCRECIYKWHKIKKGKDLSPIQQEYLVEVIMLWIRRQMN